MQQQPHQQVPVVLTQPGQFQQHRLSQVVEPHRPIRFPGSKNDPQRARYRSKRPRTNLVKFLNFTISLVFLGLVYAASFRYIVDSNCLTNCDAQYGSNRYATLENECYSVCWDVHYYNCSKICSGIRDTCYDTYYDCSANQAEVKAECYTDCDFTFNTTHQNTTLKEQCYDKCYGAYETGVNKCITLFNDCRKVSSQCDDDCSKKRVACFTSCDTLYGKKVQQSSYYSVVMSCYDSITPLIFPLIVSCLHLCFVFSLLVNENTWSSIGEARMTAFAFAVDFILLLGATGTIVYVVITNNELAGSSMFPFYYSGNQIGVIQCVAAAFGVLSFVISLIDFANHKMPKKRAFNPSANIESQTTRDIRIDVCNPDCCDINAKYLKMFHLLLTLSTLLVVVCQEFFAFIYNRNKGAVLGLEYNNGNYYLHRTGYSFTGSYADALGVFSAFCIWHLFWICVGLPFAKQYTTFWRVQMAVAAYVLETIVLGIFLAITWTAIEYDGYHYNYYYRESYSYDLHYDSRNDLYLKQLNYAVPVMMTFEFTIWLLEALMHQFPGACGTESCNTCCNEQLSERPNYQSHPGPQAAVYYVTRPTTQLANSGQVVVLRADAAPPPPYEMVIQTQQLGWIPQEASVDVVAPAPSTITSTRTVSDSPQIDSEAVAF